MMASSSPYLPGPFGHPGLSKNLPGQKSKLNLRSYLRNLCWPFLRLYYKTRVMNKSSFFSSTLQQFPFSLLLLLLVCFLLGSCSKDEDTSPDDTAQLRIENLSPFVINQLLVEAGGGGEQAYNNLQPGQLSEYKAFEYIYRYGFIQAVINNDTLTLQPTDYVGEQRYTNGFYSYLIDITVDNNQPAYMTLDFRED
jgi:hypothetical protein